MLSVGLVIGAAFSAFLAIRSGSLLNSAIWLALSSVFVSILLYVLGAHEVAVIELSVGAGLVTILFIFAIAISGDTPGALRSTIPHVLTWAAAGLAIVLIGALVLPALPGAAVSPVATDLPFATMFWQPRGLDALVQVVVIFAGALGILGLLGSQRPATRPGVILSTTAESEQRTEAEPEHRTEAVESHRIEAPDTAEPALEEPVLEEKVL
ncbi:MAG TPA: hydrogenase subunit MbhD domain-containing protein [Aggregatilineales bacterium]|nr:hydrogenase subunit MbhD domain-containing protein [Aggregatilineales bacterium]